MTEKREKQPIQTDKFDVRSPLTIDNHMIIGGGGQGDT